jgi:hypothetical protein
VEEVRVLCTLPGRRGTLEEFTLVPANMAAHMDARYAANAQAAARARAEAAAAGEVQVQAAERTDELLPNVLVFMMDALANTVAHHALRDVMRMFTQQQLRSATALQFDHFSVVGYNSAPDWGAMFCNNNSDGACEAEPEGNLFEHAAAAGMNTIFMNNFCPQVPVIKSTRSRYAYDGHVNDTFVCLPGTGMRGECAHGESVSRSFLDTFGKQVLHARCAVRRVFGVVTPHEAQQRSHHKLLTIQPRLLELFRTLDAQGALADTVTLFLADHGLHYSNDLEYYAPTAAAHRNPVLVALVGNRLLPRLAATLPAALRNRGRLVSMYDVYTTLGTLIGVPPARFRPGTFDFLRQVIPRNRTCTDAGVATHCNCFQETRK